MRHFFKKVHSIGICYATNDFEERRVRLTNLSATIAIIIIIISAVANLIVGDYAHALRMLCGMILLTAPVYYANYKGNLRFARIYMVLFTIFLANFIGYVSLLSGEQRFNEYLLFGVAAFVLVLFDGKIRIVIFIFTALSALFMHMIRYVNSNPNLDSDLYLALINMTISYTTVYLFISIFRSQIEENTQKISDDALQLKKQKEIIEEKTFALRSMLNNVPIFMGLLTLDGKYQVVNSKYSHAFNSPIEEIEGRYASEFLSKKMNILHQGYIERALRGLETEFDKEVITDSGERFYLYGKMIPLFDDQKKVKALVEYGTDITDLKKAETELKILNETKSKLLSIISHDLKSPLSSLTSLLTISDDIGEGDLKKLIHKIRNRTQVVSFSLDNLLAWVKTQLQGFTVKKEKVNISAKFKEVISLYESKIASKLLNVKNRLPENLEVYCDPDNLSLVCRNFFNNAIKFTPIGGNIELTSIVSKEFIEIYLKDSGVGMSQKTVKDVMNNQINETTPGTKGELGTGLGLGFCLDVLKRNKAQFFMESELGAGTTIKIMFDRVE